MDNGACVYEVTAKIHTVGRSHLIYKHNIWINRGFFNKAFVYDISGKLIFQKNFSESSFLFEGIERYPGLSIIHLQGTHNKILKFFH